MQYDMYHHYTVDEHSIRSIGLLGKIERGELDHDHTLSSAIMRKVVSRRELYVSVLLHDIAKGRGGDHSVLVADVARQLCPRLSLTHEETEHVAWIAHKLPLRSMHDLQRDLASTDEQKA